MKIAKFFAIATAAALVIACGAPKVEGSKEVRDLHPAKGEIDSTSYMLGVNFGLVITQNNFGDLNLAELRRGMNDALKAKEGQPMDSIFCSQFKIDPSGMNEIIMIAHGNCPEDAEYLKNQIEERLGFRKFMVNSIGPMIGSHTGPTICLAGYFGETRS